MSTSTIYLIPDDPEFVPAVALQEQAVEFLRSFVPPGDTMTEISSSVEEQVEFVDQGGNFERIECPFCSSTLAVAWWGDAMDSAYESHFADLATVTPCCSRATTLNDLHYVWPAGFSRFSLEIYDPDMDIDESMLQELQNLLACRLRIIWNHL